MPSQEQDRCRLPTRSTAFIYGPINSGGGRLGGRETSEFAMKTSLVVALTVAFVLAGASALAVMNKACKSGHHPWSAPARTHVKVGT
jgi:hypothetical protein